MKQYRVDVETWDAVIPRNADEVTFEGHAIEYHAVTGFRAAIEMARSAAKLPNSCVILRGPSPSLKGRKMA